MVVTTIPDSVSDEVQVAQDLRENEYLLTDDQPSDCATCEREALVLPLIAQSTGAAADALDQETIGESSILQYPLGSEVFPQHAAGDRASLEGILDVLATQYPEQAAILLGMCAPESEQLGAGYEVEYVTAERRVTLEAELRDVKSRIDHLQEQSTEYHLRASRALTPADENALRQLQWDARDRNIANYKRLRELEHLLGSLTYWHIDPVAKKFIITDTINYNIDRPFLELEELFTGDDDISEQPTNGEAAAWLARVIDYNLDPEKEFVREKWRRRATGSALFVFGALECIAGGALIYGSGGLASAGGLVVTVAGYNSIETGWRMLQNSDPSKFHTHLDQMVGYLGEGAGGAEGRRNAADMWAVFQIAAGLGGAVSLTRVSLAGQTRMALGNVRRLAGVVPTKAALHALEMTNVAALKGGLRIVMRHLPSARGILAQMPDGGKMVISAGDHLLRVLVRMRFTPTQTLFRRIALLKVDADPVRRLTGPASRSHPEEIARMEQQIIEAGGEVDKQAGRLVYEPGAVGHPGTVRIDPNASYSAWLHEFRHFQDDLSSGWQAQQILHGNPQTRWAWERAAYQQEINYVRSLRNVPKIERDAVIRELEVLSAREHAHIYNTFFAR